MGGCPCAVVICELRTNRCLGLGVDGGWVDYGIMGLCAFGEVGESACQCLSSSPNHKTCRKGFA